MPISNDRPLDPGDNPFRPGAGTSPPAFAGRDEPLRDFDVTLRQAKAQRPGKSVIATGLRGVGKTTLLNRFTDAAEALDFKVAYIEAPERGDFTQHLAIAVRRILLEYDRQKISHVVTQALRVFKSFSLSITKEGTPALTLDIDPMPGLADTGDLTADVIDLFRTLGEAARDRDSAVLFAIDELQNVKREELESLIMAVHRVNQRNLPLVLAGTGLPSVIGLAGEAKTYAERLFLFPTIGSLTEDETYHALADSVEPLGIRFSDDALRRIYAETGGYPYFVQEWGYAAWNHAMPPTIEEADVEAVTPIVHRKLDEGFFRVRLDRLTDRERTYLRGMADAGPQPQRTADVARAIGSTQTGSSGVRDSLIKKGMIYSSDSGEIAFTVPLFDSFLRRTLPDQRRVRSR